ncbi:MAG: winged helix-turn-helix transcriptional regulator [Planctomycetota bacterium]|jgi:DNA-binding MarR family transcriptional regulator
MSKSKKQAETVVYNPKDNKFTLSKKYIEKLRKKYPNSHIDVAKGEAENSIQNRIELVEDAKKLQLPETKMMEKNLEKFQRQIQESPCKYLEYCMTSKWELIASPEEKKLEDALANLRQSRRHQQSADLSGSIIPVDDKELTILVELSEGIDKTYSQIEIAIATNIPRSTIKDKLSRLEKNGLVHRPLGKRKGYKITNKGQRIAQRNQ